MVKFKEVDPTAIPNIREPHRGRVSYPILKGFLETGMFVAELDRTGMQQTLQSLYSSLNAYIRNHKMPIKMFSRKGEIYLMRLDIDENGDPIEDWERKKDVDPNVVAVAITKEEVARRFEEEKDQTTK